jgi:hypothetical protein
LLATILISVAFLKTNTEKSQKKFGYSNKFAPIGQISKTEITPID